MKLGIKKAGTSTTFIDTNSGEMLLQFSWSSAGLSNFAYHIYDENGALISDSDGIQPIHSVTILNAENELLLDVPADIEQHIRYRLYNKDGRLLTVSDGVRTQIYGYLRMEANRPWLQPEPLTA